LLIVRMRGELLARKIRVARMARVQNESLFHAAPGGIA